MNTDASTTATQTAAVAEQSATNAPKQAKASKPASRKKNAPKASKGAKKAAAKKQAKPAAAKKTAKAKDDDAPREGSKKQVVLLLLARKEGATMAEIADATGWQKHSIRGFISGNVTKKMGLVVESTKNEQGERTYRTK